MARREGPPATRALAAFLPLLLILMTTPLADAQDFSTDERRGFGNTLTKISLKNPRLLTFILSRLSEPIFMQKGFDTEQVIIRVPPSYLSDRFRPLAKELLEKVTDAEEVKVPEVQLPDLSQELTLGRHRKFSNFIPRHRRMARRLIEVLLALPTYEDFVSATVFYREHVNAFLYAYAVAVALLHRPDTRGLPLPNAACLFPQKFFDGAVFPLMRQEANVLDPGQRIPVEIPRDWTATDLEPEHRVAYFREDVGINLHHWHWHLLYPFEGPRVVVLKDRRGELFYYLHEQIMARYNFERFSNNLGRAKRLLNLREPIAEAYFPKLNTQIASHVWPPRQAFSKLQDINRPELGISFDILDLERWRDRIFEAIHTRSVRTERGESVPLDERQGIDILGNIVESSILSVDRNFYGDMHNLGHVAIAFVHDPDNRHLEPFGVMGDQSTAMRDPVFYRWHAFVDDIFQEHKAMLPRYTSQELGFEGMRVNGLQLQTQGLPAPNELLTFWQQTDMDLARGLDFAPRGPVFVRITHLQHLPFTYRIQVQNAGSAREGTFRIFLAPRNDERKQPMQLREQRSHFIELDKFRVRLPPGSSTVIRWSNQSSVTIPPERTFRNLEARPAGPAGEFFDYCGCGWPQHMLIPKGTPEGLEGDLFVMISDNAVDQVDQQPILNACSDGHSYCGIKGQLYPDRRSMGYPFDRPPRAATLQEFLQPNMAAARVLVRHENRVVPPAVARPALLLDPAGGPPQFQRPQGRSRPRR